MQGCYDKLKCHPFLHKMVKSQFDGYLYHEINSNNYSNAVRFSLLQHITSSWLIKSRRSFSVSRRECFPSLPAKQPSLTSLTQCSGCLLCSNLIGYCQDIYALLVTPFAFAMSSQYCALKKLYSDHSVKTAWKLLYHFHFHGQAKFFVWVNRIKRVITKLQLNLTFPKILSNLLYQNSIKKTYWGNAADCCHSLIDILFLYRSFLQSYKGMNVLRQMFFNLVFLV